MQADPRYADVVSEVRDFLVARAHACEAAGIARDRIVIDPGFGFGKTVAHNLALLRSARRARGDRLSCSGRDCRGSRRWGAITGRDVGDRAAASVAAALAAVARGASIVRVHDVRETVDALKVWQAIRNSMLNR